MKLSNTRDRSVDVPSNLRPIFSDSLHFAACHTFVSEHNARGTGRGRDGSSLARLIPTVITGNYFRQLSSISIHVVSIGAELSGIKAGSRMPAASVKRPASWAFTLKTRQILACSLTRSLTPAQDLSDVREISPRIRYYLFGLARSGSHEYREHYVCRRRTVRRRWCKKGENRERKNGVPMIRQVTHEQPETTDDPRKSPLYQMEVYRDTGEFSRYRDTRRAFRGLKPEKERERDRERKRKREGTERETERERGRRREPSSRSIAYGTLALPLARSHSHFSWFSPISLPSPSRGTPYSGEHVGREWEVFLNDFARRPGSSDRTSRLSPREECRVTDRCNRIDG